MSTPRVEAMKAWTTALQGMTGVRPWGGSYPNPPRVERVLKNFAQVNSLPTLCLLPDTGSRIVPATQDRYEDRFHAMVIGYVTGTPDIPAADLVLHLLRDCVVTLLAVEHLGASIYLDEFGDEEVAFDLANNATFTLPFMAHLEDAFAAAA